MKTVGPIVAAALMLAAAPATAQVFAAAATVDENVLKTVTGREDVNQTTQANNRGEVSNNSVGDNNVTGTINLADNAFQNMSGLSILSVNSGNNVAINAAMNVNIAINQGP